MLSWTLPRTALVSGRTGRMPRAVVQVRGPHARHSGGRRTR